MTRKTTPKLDDPAQSQRLIDAAKEGEADETDEALEKAFEKLARILPSYGPSGCHPRPSGKR